jgi:hypothetical protein
MHSRNLSKRLQKPRKLPGLSNLLSIPGCLSIFVLLFFLVSSLTCAEVFAQEPEETLLYQEDFENGEPAGWELEPGWGVIQEGNNRVLAGEGHVWANSGIQTVNQSRILYRLKLIRGGVNLVFRLNNNGRYFISFDEGGSNLNKQYWPDTFIYNLAGSDTYHTPGAWHQIEIASDGNNLRFLVDGVLEWEYNDPEALTYGSFALETIEDSEAHVDDIQVFSRPSGEVRAQELVYLRAVEPSEGNPGQELELTLWGGGFGDAQEVRLAIGDIEILDARIESDEAIMVHVFIPEDAPPGPRPIEVVAVFGSNEEFEAVLDEGFFVLERRSQPSPVVDGVEPQQVLRGSQVELSVLGSDFLPDPWVEIGGAGVLVHEVEFISSEQLLAFIEVEEEAPSGWREVVVINPDDQTGGRQHALQVVGEVPPSGPSPTPTPPSNGGVPPWVWAGAAVVLLVLGATIARILTLRTRLTWKRTAQLQWQLEANTELPESKEACTWACKTQVTTELLKRWKVTALELTPLPLPSGKTPPVKRVDEDEILDLLTDAVQPQFVLEDEARTRQRVAPVVDALLEQILAWKKGGQTPASIKVDARLTRDVKCEFKLYHCEKTGVELDWVDSGLKWKGTLHQPGGEYLGVLRGPTAGEPDFTTRAREELEGFLLKLVKGVRFKL